MAAEQEGTSARVPVAEAWLRAARCHLCRRMVPLLVDEDDIAAVALGPAKVDVGDEARVGVVGLDVYPLRTLGDLPRPVLRPDPPLVTRVSATGGPPALMYCWYSAAVAHWVQLMPNTKALAAMMSPVVMDPSNMLDPC